MELQEQEQIMQLTTSWEQKGIVKGSKEGRQEGQSNTILRLLHRKFGSLPSAIVQQVKSLEPNRLDALTEDLLDFNSLDDLQSWLSHSGVFFEFQG
jgi:HPt (histidine-containing phosphotransfer) domain-containing protein